MLKTFKGAQEKKKIPIRFSTKKEEITLEFAVQKKKEVTLRLSTKEEKAEFLTA